MRPFHSNCWYCLLLVQHGCSIGSLLSFEEPLAGRKTGPRSNCQKSSFLCTPFRIATLEQELTLHELVFPPSGFGAWSSRQLVASIKVFDIIGCVVCGETRLQNTISWTDGLPLPISRRIVLWLLMMAEPGGIESEGLTEVCGSRHDRQRGLDARSKDMRTRNFGGSPSDSVGQSTRVARVVRGCCRGRYLTVKAVFDSKF